MILAWNARDASRPVKASCLSIGPVRMIQLPGETLVEYQLFVQNKTPDHFVVVAAYSECGMWYIRFDQISKGRGGYEQTLVLRRLRRARAKTDDRQFPEVNEI
ncbi:hypothetical protein F1728_04675 [Gimesia benthica]|uniref:Uncharacterized protein n=1 Tax=Gimesia benthica TaxID=2608982 RepID=A0A6I6A7R4_9PLAN|nr:hypothetical protein [Gimesia benthica]QGQ22028.1 hypothetical protein F1728_04675 [Gimesia benthica]